MRCSLLLAGALALAACQLPPKTPTEAAVEPGAPAEAGPPTTPAPQESSLCAAYQRQLAASRATLAQDPESTSLREEVATFEAVIADACP